MNPASMNTYIVIGESGPETDRLCNYLPSLPHCFDAYEQTPHFARVLRACDGVFVTSSSFSGILTVVSIAKDWPGVPVFVAGFDWSPEEQALALESGATAYLNLPVQEEVIQEVLGWTTKKNNALPVSMSAIQYSHGDPGGNRGLYNWNRS
ncbi:MAG: hypothetical protein H7039_21195 [Bryobacteraceae bacterium]|nr:hypothetical protein [Bryobacteraceae bacterium]